MSFYNADPRAYFQWVEYKAYDADNRTVTKDDDSEVSIDNLEVGRLVKVENKDDDTFQIYKVTIINNQKVLEEINFTNQNIVSVEKGIKIGNNSLAVNVDGQLTFNGGVLTTAKALEEGVSIEYLNESAAQGTQTIGTITAYEGKTETAPGTKIGEYPIILPKTIVQETSINTLNTNDLDVVNKIIAPTIEGKDGMLSLYPSGVTKIGAHDQGSGMSQGLQVGNYKIAILNETAYDNLEEKESNTLYFVIPDLTNAPQN